MAASSGMQTPATSRDTRGQSHARCAGGSSRHLTISISAGRTPKPIWISATHGSEPRSLPSPRRFTASREMISTAKTYAFTRRTRHVIRGAVSVLVLLLCLALALGALAWQQRSEARTSASRARREADSIRSGERAILSYGLAGASLAALHAGRTDLALLLSVEAERSKSTAQSESSLLTALLDQPTLERQLHGLISETSPLGFSPDGNLYAASDGDQVLIWNLRTGQPLPHQPHAKDGQFADGGRFFVSTEDQATCGLSESQTAPCLGGFCALPTCELNVWDLATGRILRRIPGVAPHWVTSEDAPVLAAIANDGTLNVWNVRSGIRHSSISIGAPADPQIALSPDGSTAVVLSTVASPFGVWDFELHAWNTRSGSVGPGCALNSTLSSGGQFAVQALRILNDDSTLRVVISIPLNVTPALVASCDAVTGHLESRVFDPTVSREVAGVSPDGPVIATREIGTGTIQLVRASDGSKIGGDIRAPFGGWMRTMTGTVTFSPDSRLFSATEYDGDVRIWRTTSQTVLERAAPGLVPARGVERALSLPENRQLYVMKHGDVIDSATDRKVAHIPNFVSSSNSAPPSGTVVAASANGDLLGALTGNTLTVIDLSRNTSRSEHVDGPCQTRVEALAITEGRAAFSCRFSPPYGRASLRAIDLVASPWKAGAPAPVGPGLDPATLDFSPNGRTLAVVGPDNNFGGLQLVDLAGTDLHPREAILGRGVTGAFTPDSRAYVVVHESGKVERLSIVPRNAPPTLIALPSAGVRAVLGISPEGRFLITNGPGKAIGLWDLAARQLLATIPGMDVDLGGLELDPAIWEREACAIASRNLTRDEWARYLPGTPYQKTCSTQR
jgi:WD40 repeat protein